MSGPSVYLTLPSWDILRFPPAPLPPSLPPPIRERSLRSPFGIQPWLFNLAMRPEVPFGFAAAYILLILYLNGYNKSRGNKPWWISQQAFFKHFVVVHNVVLALYSLATFLAMWRAIVHTWPGLNNDAGLAGVADALCKLHGPRILGDAVTYNTTINIWESKNQFIKITGAGSPDPTDVGRLWNEGLAFWGWIFYLSKFYEVLDTFIIISKGKRSPTLQTYHHAGAMLCMWAGMRYMSPPIWMFVFVNSAIHTMMYVYFALSALDIKVNQNVKRTLTTLQIAQFIFGATYAGLHLFVKYDIPIATPYKVAAAVTAAASSASSAFTSATSVVSQAIESPTISASLGVLIKKLLLRAAGEEGVAERIAIPSDQPVTQAIESRLDQIHERTYHRPRFETRYRTEWTKVNCIDTSGEAFAIWLNLLYLLPLTVLFARFFIRAYTQRTDKARTSSEAAKMLAEDAKLAEDETERVVEDAGRRAEDEIRNRSGDVKENVKSLHDQLREDVKKMREGNYGSQKVNERVQKFEKQVKDVAEKAKEQVASAAGSAQRAVSKKAEKFQDGKDSAKPQSEPAQETEGGADDQDDDKENKPPVGKSAPSSRPEASKPEASKQQSQSASESKPESSKPTSQSSPESKPESSKPDQKSAAEHKSQSNPASSEPAQKADAKPESGSSKPQQKGSGKPTAETKKVPAQDISEEKQDNALAESEPVRPGASAGAQKGGEEDDTDAMGKSGVDLDTAGGEEQDKSGKEKEGKAGFKPIGSNGN